MKWEPWAEIESIETKMIACRTFTEYTTRIECITLDNTFPCRHCAYQQLKSVMDKWRFLIRRFTYVSTQDNSHEGLCCATGRQDTLTFSWTLSIITVHKDMLMIELKSCNWLCLKRIFLVIVKRFYPLYVNKFVHITHNFRLACSNKYSEDSLYILCFMFWEISLLKGGTWNEM